MSDAPVASVVISTFNRAGALRETLLALDGQSAGTGAYEVVVVDDGSTDDTPGVLASVGVGYALRTARHEHNRGVSAGRNTGIRMARGRYVIFVSDDVIVTPTFVDDHVRTLERLPRSWVVGGFRQLPSLAGSAFGRYLEDLERGFDEGRRGRSIAPNLWELAWPTARNLSLPRDDLDRTGLFDERFRTCCEDQDLASRARAAGIRFVHDDTIDCLHNDQAGDLRRYCDFQRRGARDTVLLCALHPDLHGGSPLIRANGPVARGDGPGLVAKKLAKAALSRPRPRAALERSLVAAERLRVPEPVLRRGFTAAIALAIFRGWREGLRAGATTRAPATAGAPATSDR